MKLVHTIKISLTRINESISKSQLLKAVHVPDDTYGICHARNVDQVVIWTRYFPWKRWSERSTAFQRVHICLYICIKEKRGRDILQDEIYG